MKKNVSILVISAMLLACFAVSAVPEKEASLFPADAGTHLEGYIVGDGAGETGAKWVGFSSENPGETELYTFHLTTYGAAYANGTVYGFVWGYDDAGVLHDEFYSIDLDTRIATYYDGTHSGEIVYGMAYDSAQGVMYALVNDDNPHIATVDLATGALTNAFNVQLGSYLGVYGLAIDSEGNMYCMTLSAISGKLVKVNKQTGALTELANSGMPCYYAQCITYDCATNRIYWAEVDGPNTASNGLYSFDLSNNYAFAYHGVIGTNYELMAMYSTAKAGGPEIIPGDVDMNGAVELADALLALRGAMELVELTDAQAAAADVNGSGSVGADDALLILRFSMGLIENF